MPDTRTSSGKLPMGQSVERMKQGYSKIRNEAIAHAFSYMKLMEHWGSGIPRIIESVVAAGLRETEFIDGDIDLKINIFRGQNGDNVTKDVTNVAQNDTDQSPEKKIIELIIVNPEITQVKMAEELGITTRTVKCILAKLQDENKVLREGTNL